MAIEQVSRLRVSVYGAVQGVGFRPFVYRLARRLRVFGTVRNSSAGVFIEAEGPPATLERFLALLETEKPSAAWIAGMESARLDPAGYERFRILPSDDQAEKTAFVLPDLATCPDCVAEIFDPADRRHGYPFTNCTHCGPRFSIIERIPYDRPNTTMRHFVMCPVCRKEYEDPEDRRFHAQPNACPDCGPRLELAGRDGTLLPEPALERSVRLVRDGGTLALKGIGGFQLLVDATRGDAVARLRRAKNREEKPFAVLFPSVDRIRRSCLVTPEEKRLLTSPAAPIVLLRPRREGELAPNVSMSSPWIGAMIPYSPLHHLLMAALDRPVVATSGNRSEEPIVTDNREAVVRLGVMADAFLWHDRPIARPCDDSVCRAARGRELVLRRARGYAPLPIPLRHPAPPVLAVGAHMKNAVAIAVGRQVFVGQHVGDLDTAEARSAFARAIDDLCRLYGFRPGLVACDLHPDYHSTRHAESLGLPVVRVQHHEAHVAACAAENDVEEPYLGAAWDGTGYGPDGTVWGGEFFLRKEGRFHRVAHFRTFPLPGGERAVRDARRAAFGLWETASNGDLPRALDFTDGEAATLRAMIRRGVNSPQTSSAGRLFDAVSALAGVARESRFEGQAAMLLEAAVPRNGGADRYPTPVIEENGRLVLDWEPLLEQVVADARRGRAPQRIALAFHNAMVNWLVEVARRVGVPRVVMSGGVFQNGYLAEHACRRLEAAGFRSYSHQRVPPNDGGIALGQAVLAAGAVA